jgi:hypothetical protein
VESYIVARNCSPDGSLSVNVYVYGGERVVGMDMLRIRPALTEMVWWVRGGIRGTARRAAGRA